VHAPSQAEGFGRPVYRIVGVGGQLRPASCPLRYALANALNLADMRVLKSLCGFADADPNDLTHTDGGNTLDVAYVKSRHPVPHASKDERDCCETPTVEDLAAVKGRKHSSYGLA
jgi:hypothetical protein